MREGKWRRGSQRPFASQVQGSTGCRSRRVRGETRHRVLCPRLGLRSPQWQRQAAIA